MEEIRPSATVAVSDKARELAQEGKDIINLGGGEPDFDTPEHIIEAGIKAIKDGKTHYVSSLGIPELRTAVSRKLYVENGLTYTPDEIMVNPGAKLGLYAAIMALVDQGDEVLVFDPSWVSYDAIIRLAGGTPVHVPLDREDNFTIRSEVISENITSRSRIIILNSPNNPTGRILTLKELEVVAAAAEKHDLFVLSDEIYEKIAYDGNKPVSFGTVDGMLERTIVINGFSKAYAMTGWRLGYVAAKKPLMKELLKVQQHSVTCAAAFTQYAGVAALEGPQDVIEDMVSIYDNRRRIITDGLNSLPGVSCEAPEGAFYSFPDISGTGMSSMEFTNLLLTEAGVAVTPGIAFGECADGHVRLSFANSTKLIENAIARMNRLLT